MKIPALIGFPQGWQSLPASPFSALPFQKGETAYGRQKRNTQRKHIRSEGAYSLDEIRSLTMDDGTRVITSADGDIKRPVCAGIDVHEGDPYGRRVQNRSPPLLMRSFMSGSSSPRTATSAPWPHGSKARVCRMSAWNPPGNTGYLCSTSWNSAAKGRFLTHPKYVKQAKGQKTDFRDAVHIASMFRMDLVVASFIPPADIRDLRELCRYRLKLTYMRTSEKNRFQNSMTVSKVRLDCVFSDPFGKSASSIMEYLIMTEPEDVSDKQILSMVDRRVKASGEDILDSIHGYEFIGIQRDKLKVINLHLGQINECIRLIDEKLDYFRQKYSRIIRHLATMVGVTEESALYILGEIGTDMSVWRDDASLASWAGLSPANNASAGKKKSTRTGDGGHYLKPLLVQCALAAAKSTKKDPYFHYKYETLKKRRGHKKAIIAIARKMLVAIYHMIRDDADFLPVDHEEVLHSTKKQKGLNLDNVIAFLKEQGADDDTLRLVERQCGAQEMDAAEEMESVSSAEKKQSVSGSAATSQPIQESVNGSPVLISGSQKGRALNHHPKDSAVATATAQNELL